MELGLGYPRFRSNDKYDNLKSPAGKTDYHTMGACYEVFNAI